MSPYALSVDYGTSNTVAVLRRPDGRTRPLLFDGSPLLPSAVYAMPAGHLATGRDAINSARLDPTRFEPNPKRHIDELDLLLGERGHPLPALIAATLARVAQEARNVAGQPVGELVMTHPAEWGAARRAVLTEAARAAGLPAPRLVPEPVAAGTYFSTVLGHGVAPGRSVVVYDLGGGTFDASVVRRGADGFETLAYRGLDDAGGVDLDELVVQQIGAVIGPVAPAEWRRLLAPASLADRRAARTLRDDARMVKERLSRESSAALLIPIVDRDIHVTREEFEARSRPLIARTVAITAATMKAARTPRDLLVGLFLVGGSTRMPLVATELHRATGIAPTVLDQPELVVAEGALLVGGGGGGTSMPDPGHGWHASGPVAPTSPAPVAPERRAPVPAHSVSANPVAASPASVPPDGGAGPPMPVPTGSWPGPDEGPAAEPGRPADPGRPAGARPARGGPPAVVWGTSTAAIASRASLSLLLVPVLFGAGLGLGALTFEVADDTETAWIVAAPLWVAGVVWLVACGMRLATAGRQVQRLVVDGAGLTVTARDRPHRLAWDWLARAGIRRRGLFLRPVLVVVPRPGAKVFADPWWLTRRVGASGGLAVADLRTLRAAPDAVRAAVDAQFRTG